MKLRDYIEESRPKLIKFSIHKTDTYIIVKNMVNNVNIRMLIDYANLRKLLKNINAYDSESPVTNGINIDRVITSIKNGETVEIYVPENRINYIKLGAEKNIKNVPTYTYKDTEIDTDKYTKVYTKDGKPI